MLRSVDGSDDTNDDLLSLLEQQRPTQFSLKKGRQNEIKITSKGLIKNYLGYAFRILNKTNHRNLKIRATGNAIVKALILIELVKRRVPELHQLNKIYSMELKSTKEPKI